MSFTISLASLILLSLSIAGAYCRSISTTSIPARLRRSSFSPSSIAAATLFRSLAFQTAFVPTCQNSPRRVFVYYISLKTIAFIWSGRHATWSACPFRERWGALQRSLRQRSRKRAKHQKLRAQPLLRDVLDARSSDGSVQTATTSSRLAATGTGFWLTLPRAPLISTTPHGATRMAVRATVDTTRSHAGAPVRDGLRLINA
jgi:hypothetical protein